MTKSTPYSIKMDFSEASAMITRDLAEFYGLVTIPKYKGIYDQEEKLSVKEMLRLNDDYKNGDRSSEVLDSALVGSTVYLAGSFNKWDPQGLKMVDKDGNGLYSVSVTLAPGIYEYKFVINGVWTLDPDPDRDWTQNGLGTLNSVLRVG